MLNRYSYYMIWNIIHYFSYKKFCVIAFLSTNYTSTINVRKMLLLLICRSNTKNNTQLTMDIFVPCKYSFCKLTHNFSLLRWKISMKFHFQPHWLSTLLSYCQNIYMQNELTCNEFTLLVASE